MNSYLIAHSVASGIAAFYVLWGLYLAAMSLMRAYRTRTLSRTAFLLGVPMLVITLLIDVLVNLTLGTLLLADRPREWTLSQRLTRLGRGAGWRAVVSRWVCTRLLDQFDPSGRHCDC